MRSPDRCAPRIHRRHPAGTIGNLLNVVGADDVHSGCSGSPSRSRAWAFRFSSASTSSMDIALVSGAAGGGGIVRSGSWALTAREAAAEASADGVAMTFAPMLDVSRDPRWGRGVEGPGEDPWLAARFAEAKVRGFQGADLAARTRWPRSPSISAPMGR
jgi:beta-glucosidase